MKINKKHKKSYNNTGELDLVKLSDELVQKPKQLVKKDSVKKRGRRR